MTAHSKWLTPGRVFGRLTTVERITPRGVTPPKWRCRCECGNDTVVQSSNLCNGHTTSCGCYSQECRTARATHGHARQGKWTREYRIWRALFDRCCRPSSKAYKNYGGRGIAVCDRWSESYEAFYADMGPCPSPQHSIDRINNNGHYEPGNCRWATPKEQAANRRRNPYYDRGTNSHLLGRSSGIGQTDSG